jgi:hypothetical protein
MAVLARILMILFAYVLACIAAAIVLTIGTLAPHWDEVGQLGAQSPDWQAVALWSVVAVSSGGIAIVALVPALLVIVMAEGLALRSSVVYGVLGCLLALAMSYGLDFAGFFDPQSGLIEHEREVLAAAGIAGGLVYWLFAGRRAGLRI